MALGVSVSCVGRPSNQESQSTPLPSGLDAYAPPFLRRLPYDPSKAEGLARIRTELALDPGTEARLGRDGFAYLPTSERTFFTAYARIYKSHLPLFVSADSILNALHLSYQSMRTMLEKEGVRDDLQNVLTRGRARLAGGAGSSFGAVARADVDLYLAVADTLLQDKPAPPVAGASPTNVAAWLGRTALPSLTGGELWGSRTQFDGSQLVPRGNYDSDPALSSYFRSWIWLTRAEIPVVEPDENHRLHVHRRGLAAALALAASLDADARASLERVAELPKVFVGGSPTFDLAVLLAMQKTFGLHSLSAVDALDETSALAWIASKVPRPKMLTKPTSGSGPAIVFSLTAQVETVDGQTLASVPSAPGRPPRLPTPLDVAFAVLENDQAWSLLEAERRAFDYGAALEAERARVDALPSTRFSSSLYGLWLSALRTLSPTRDVSNPRAVGLPSVAGTEAWGRRLLDTQLASYAELRHDTILYTKPMYMEIGCEFPTAYVEPQPAFFARLGDYARRGRALSARLSLSPASRTRVVRYFDDLETSMKTLEEMATAQRKGEPLSAAHLAFVNEAVTVTTVGCGQLEAKAGWYRRLFFDPEEAIAAKPTIADIATDTETNTILHVATARPRLFVMTAETCDGPRAFVGVTSDYREQRGNRRLTEWEWASELAGPPKPPVPFLADLVP